MHVSYLTQHPCMVSLFGAHSGFPITYWAATMIGRKRHGVHFVIYSTFLRTSQVAQLVKNPPAMRETPDRFWGWEDPLEKG